MELTEARYERIAPHLPARRGNVRAPDPQALNAILHVAGHGRERRGLPGRFGNWRAIHMRMNRWPGNGALGRVFEQPQRERIARTEPEAAPMDGAVAEARPGGAGAPRKTAPDRPGARAAAGPPGSMWLPRMPGPPSRSRPRRDRPAAPRKGASR